MAITGFTIPVVGSSSDQCCSEVSEAVETSIKLLALLGMVGNEVELRESLTRDYTRLESLGRGRLYIELPAAIATNQLISLADKLGHDDVFMQESFYVPGVEPSSLAEKELNGIASTVAARIALHSEDSSCDPLLHFTDHLYSEGEAERGELTQLEAFAREKQRFMERHPGATLRTADVRDFLVWFLMDRIRWRRVQDVVLSECFMRIPSYGRRVTEEGDSVIGCVFSYEGRATLSTSGGDSSRDAGIGLSAGFNE